jgi:hypothetical protein
MDSEVFYQLLRYIEISWLWGSSVSQVVNESLAPEKCNGYSFVMWKFFAT